MQVKAPPPHPSPKHRAVLGQLSDMDLRLLQVFKSVVECGGMSAAELELNIGTSTVSRHMKDLETRLATCMETLQGFNGAEIAKTAFGRGEQANLTALATWVSAQNTWKDLQQGAVSSSASKAGSSGRDARRAFQRVSRSARSRASRASCACQAVAARPPTSASTASAVAPTTARCRRTKRAAR